MPYKCTCFIKPDLDTVVTAFLLLRRQGLGPICHLAAEAPDAWLDNRRILCIECGGSGRVDDADFDHHGTGTLPCAAEQAWEYAGQPQVMRELVHYTACVDMGRPSAARRGGEGGITLSALFSGMRFCHTSPVAQFMAGLSLLGHMQQRQLPPVDVTPLVRRSPVAARYAEAKRAAQRALEAEQHRMTFQTVAGLAVGALTANLPGVHGLLRQAGADVSVAGNIPLAAGVQRWSVSVRPGLEKVIWQLEQVLAGLESGWGGPAGGGIVCAPREGSRLTLSAVLSCVEMAVCRHAERA